MKENINIAKILKDAPKGTKLWSPLFGDVTFSQITEVDEIITCETNISTQAFEDRARFDKYGHIFLTPFMLRDPSKEVMLLPSAHHATWKDFKAPWEHKHFEPGQKVLVPYCDGTIHDKWRLTFYSHYEESCKRHFTTDVMNFSDKDVIAYKGNEDKLGKPVK
jgi:hypothetical protein